jgi:hypothetical protein
MPRYANGSVYLDAVCVGRTKMTLCRDRIACAVVMAAALTAGSQARAETLRLDPYWPEQAQGLVTIAVEIDGRPARMLFDTGAGVTSVTDDFAAALGCRPYGRATGFRMRGDRIDLRKCGPHRVAVGRRAVEVGLLSFDPSRLIPPGAPQVDGVLGLDALAGRRFMLDLAGNRLVVDEPFPGRRDGWSAGVLRLEREMGGQALTLFAEAPAATGALWLLLDSGHVGGPVFLSPGALEQLGLSDPAQTCMPINVTGVGERCVRAAAAEPLIYDGVLGESFLRQFVIAVDLARSRVSWRRNPAPEERRS